MQTLVWTIASGDRVARVSEDGEVEGDAELVERLRRELRQPVTVYREGTIVNRGGASAAAIELRPGDGRYVVARIRSLCAGAGGEFEIVDCHWR